LINIGRISPALLYALAFLALAGGSAVSQTRDLDSMTTEEWVADLDFLCRELPAGHKNLFFKISEDRFREMAEELRSLIPELERAQIQVGFLKLVAAVGDAHTRIYIAPTNALPLMVYWFDDGIFILNTTEEYRGALYRRITGVGGRPIEEVIDSLRLVIPDENEAQVKNAVGSLLTDTYLLVGLGLIGNNSKTSLTFRGGEGVDTTMEIQAVPLSEPPAWLVDITDEEDVPLYRRNADLYYWYHFLEDSGTLYVKYNACRPMPDESFAEFTEEVFGVLDGQDARRLVIDLRHNGGGNSGLFAPFLEKIKKRDAINQKGRLFVLVGRRTFSSAVLNALEMKNQTEALIAGEPTGGKPNHFGEIRLLRLPNSGLPVQYSTKYFSVSDEDTPSLIPDIAVEMNLQHFLNGIDPVLDSALTY
jgi:hypothetical protein